MLNPHCLLCLVILYLAEEIFLFQPTSKCFWISLSKVARQGLNWKLGDSQVLILYFELLLLFANLKEGPSRKVWHKDWI